MLLRLLKISRPRFWLYVIGSFFIGIGGVMTVGEAIVLNPDVLLWILYFTLPANLFIYGINDIADFDTDQFNEKKGTYEVKVTKRDVRIILLAIAALHAFFIPLFLRSTQVVLGLFIVFILFNIFYSLPPLRLKRIPFVDSVSNGIICVAMGLMGYYLAGGNAFPWWGVAAGFLWSAVMHAYSAIPDIDSDKRAGIRTIATELGAKRTLLFSFLSYLLIGIFLYLGGHHNHVLLIVPYLILILLSVRELGHKSSVFGTYRLYPYVTYIIGMSVYGLSVYF